MLSMGALQSFKTIELGMKLMDPLNCSLTCKLGEDDGSCCGILDWGVMNWMRPSIIKWWIEHWIVAVSQLKLLLKSLYREMYCMVLIGLDAWALRTCWSLKSFKLLGLSHSHWWLGVTVKLDYWTQTVGMLVCCIELYVPDLLMDACWSFWIIESDLNWLNSGHSVDSNVSKRKNSFNF